MDVNAAKHRNNSYTQEQLRSTVHELKTLKMAICEKALLQTKYE